MKTTITRGTRPAIAKRLITPEVIQLANERLTGRKFFRGSRYVLSVERDVAKRALVVVRKLSPFLILQDAEEELLREAR